MTRRFLGLTCALVAGFSIAGVAHAASFGTQATANVFDATPPTVTDGGSGSLSANATNSDGTGASVTASGVVSAGQSTVLSSSPGLAGFALPATGTVTLNDTFTSGGGAATISVSLTGLPDAVGSSTNSYQLSIVSGANTLSIEQHFDGTTTTDQVFLNGVADAAATIASGDSTDATFTVPFTLASGSAAFVSTLTGGTSNGNGVQDISSVYSLTGVNGTFASNGTPTVPEPATFAVLGAALAGLMVARRRA